MMFVYLHAGSIIISERTYREMRLIYRGIELLSSFHRIQDARAFAMKQGHDVQDDVKLRFSGHTPEAREKIAAAKRGALNPNSKGLSWEHRRKIARAMKVRRGEHHHFYNRRHSSMSKLKISWAMRKLPKRRWAVDAAGNEHFLFAHMELPPGMSWGRKRNVNARI